MAKEKWYTFNEYYTEEGVQIPKKVAEANYIIIEKTINIKNENGKKYKHVWNICRRSEQLTIW